MGKTCGEEREGGEGCREHQWTTRLVDDPHGRPQATGERYQRSLSRRLLHSRSEPGGGAVGHHDRQCEHGETSRDVFTAASDPAQGRGQEPPCKSQTAATGVSLSSVCHKTTWQHLHFHCHSQNEKSASKMDSGWCCA